MAESKTRETMVKMNLYMPKPFKKWLELESKRSGMTQTSIIHIALKTYMDQQDTIKLMPEMLAKLKELDNMSDEEINSVKTLIDNSNILK